VRLLACAILLGALWGCGHYGPPQRGEGGESVALDAEECEEDGEGKQKAEP
jgi:hypothetical protein